MTRQTWRFNKVVPGLLLSGLLLGFVALFVAALKFYVGTGSWWTATWVSAVYAGLIYGMVRALRTLYRRPDVPDCRPIYLTSGALVALYSVVSTLGYFFPREMSIASDRAISAALWIYAPAFSREYEQAKHLSDEMDSLAMDLRARKDQSGTQKTSP